MKEKIYLLLKITQKTAETHKFILRSEKKKGNFAIFEYWSLDFKCDHGGKNDGS